MPPHSSPPAEGVAGVRGGKLTLGFRITLSCWAGGPFGSGSPPESSGDFQPVEDFLDFLHLLVVDGVVDVEAFLAEHHQVELAEVGQVL